MTRHVLNLTLLGVFTLAGIGPGTRASAQPSAEGEWGDVLTWPLEAIHMVVLKNGKVLAFDSPNSAGAPNPCLLFDPVTETVIAEFNGPENPLHILLSSGHVALSNGKIMFTGGAPPVKTTTLYDPDVDPPGPASWIPQDLGPAKRFYPTCTLLGDGTVLVIAGRHFHTDLPNNNPEADTPAIFDPNQPPGQGLQWRSLANATYADRDSADCNPAADFHLDQYPFMFLLSTGEAIYAGTDEAANDLWSTRATRTLDTQLEVWADVVDASDNPIDDPIWGGSVVMYRPDQIMKAGGRGADCDSPIASVFTLDTTAAYPTWTQRPSMANARKDHIYLLVLPDGNILATNGTSGAGPVFVPELFDPDDPAAGWTSMAPMTHVRVHHATAVLLPDARVLVAGDIETAQIFSPRYLFQGPRPSITGACSAPDTMCYGRTTSVMTPDANDVTAVSLIHPGATTHGFDFDQRFLDLSFTVVSADELSVTAPANANDAPPGHYMLFVLTGAVPSKARMVALSGGGTADCNANGVPDDCDIAGGTSDDCNCNGVPDTCDIASGSSDDCDFNGVPDECQGMFVPKGAAVSVVLVSC